MNRIRRIYYIRKVVNPLALKIYTLSFALIGLSFLVSVKNVIANMPSLLDINSIYTFTSSAFLYTEPSVQIILAIAGVSLLWLIRDIVRNIAVTPKLAHS